MNKCIIGHFSSEVKEVFVLQTTLNLFVMFLKSNWHYWLPIMASILVIRKCHYVWSISPKWDIRINKLITLHRHRSASLFDTSHTLPATQLGHFLELTLSTSLSIVQQSRWPTKRDTFFGVSSATWWFTSCFTFSFT